MTNFSDIRTVYTSFLEAKGRYWSDLQDKAWRIGWGFEEYLGLKGQNYKDTEGNLKRYFEVGEVEHGKFKAALAPSFGGDDGKILFAVKVTLDSGADIFPKTNLVVPMAIEKTGGNYEVTFESADDQLTWNLSSSLTSDELNALYEDMAVEITRRFDPKVFD